MRYNIEYKQWVRRAKGYCSCRNITIDNVEIIPEKNGLISIYKDGKLVCRKRKTSILRMEEVAS